VNSQRLAAGAADRSPLRTTPARARRARRGRVTVSWRRAEAAATASPSRRWSSRGGPRVRRPGAEGRIADSARNFSSVGRTRGGSGAPPPRTLVPGSAPGSARAVAPHARRPPTRNASVRSLARKSGRGRSWSGHERRQPSAAGPKEAQRPRVPITTSAARAVRCASARARARLGITRDAASGTDGHGVLDALGAPAERRAGAPDTPQVSGSAARSAQSRQTRRAAAACRRGRSALAQADDVALVAGEHE